MCQSFTYRQIAPSSTLLYQTIRDYWPEFNQKCELDGKGLPEYVEREFEEYLKCGELYFGFTRRVCGDCHENHLLPFSCKTRSFCPRCISRKSAETTVHLLENVIPHEPVRQWVISLPISLRYLLNRSEQLQNKVHRIIISSIEAYYKRKIGEGSFPGSITFIQRFGSALNLNLHYHVAFLDGAFIKSKYTGELVFVRDQFFYYEDVAKVLSSIAKKTIDLLVKESILDSDGELLEIPYDELLDIAPSLAKAHEASITQKIALGPRAGFPVRKIGRGMGYYEEEPKKKGKLVVALNGYTLHAGRFIKATRRDELKSLLSYMSRPPVAGDRLSKDEESGDLVYELKRPFDDGTRAIRFSPLEFLEKIVALVAPPGQNLVRYSGVFAPNSPHRKDAILNGDDDGVVSIEDDGAKASHLPWAVLMKKVYDLEVERCQKCGGPMKVIAVIESREAIDKILKHIGHATGPPNKPVRPIPELRELCFEEFSEF